MRLKSPVVDICALDSKEKKANTKAQNIFFMFLFSG
jgi:hypothetical protein